jgi:hypothetical protein
VALRPIGFRIGTLRRRLPDATAAEVGFVDAAPPGRVRLALGRRLVRMVGPDHLSIATYRSKAHPFSAEVWLREGVQFTTASVPPGSDRNGFFVKGRRS